MLRLTALLFLISLSLHATSTIDVTANPTKTQSDMVELIETHDPADWTKVTSSTTAEVKATFTIASSGDKEWQENQKKNPALKKVGEVTIPDGEIISADFPSEWVKDIKASTSTHWIYNAPPEAAIPGTVNVQLKFSKVSKDTDDKHVALKISNGEVTDTDDAEATVWLCNIYTSPMVKKNSEFIDKDGVKHRGESYQDGSRINILDKNKLDIDHHEIVGIRSDLDVEVLPGILDGKLSYKWGTKSEHIKNYLHDIDAASKHKSIAMLNSDYTKKDFKIFLKNSGAVKFELEIKYNQGILATKEFTLAIDREDDYNKYIYSTYAPHVRVTPNGTIIYDIVMSHSRFHSADLNAQLVFDVSSQAITGADNFDKSWQPFERNSSDSANGYNGTSLLGWHRSLLRAKNTGDKEFGYAPATADDQGETMPEYFSATGSGIDFNGKIKLSDFIDAEELGDAVQLGGWHGRLHYAYGQSTTLANCAIAPHSNFQLFWEIHEEIDKLYSEFEKLKKGVNP